MFNFPAWTDKAPGAAIHRQPYDLGWITSGTDVPSRVPPFLALPLIAILGEERRGERGGGKTRWAKNADSGAGGVERGRTPGPELAT